MAIPPVPAQARPVPSALQEQLLEPFIRGAIVTLAEMAGVDVVVRSVFESAYAKSADDFAAVVQLMAKTPQWFVLNVSEPAAIELAGRILSSKVGDLREALIGDCVGELANVIAGLAKTALAATPYRFAYALPTVVDRGTESPTQPDCKNALIAVLERPGSHISLRLVVVP